MAQAHIRKEIEDAIRPWRTGKPPVSLANLVLAAFLVAGEKGLTKSEAVQWIYDHFEYYRHIAMSAMGALTVAESRPPPELHQLQIEIDRVFSVYGAPIWTTSEMRDYVSVWKCDVTSGAYLWRQNRTFNDGSAAMPFRFLDLPAELRNTIYDLVFQYPSSGVYLGRRKSLRVREWCPDLPFNFDDWKRNRPDVPVSRRNHPFALLQVCRQIYEEASPSFLATNLIYFGDTYDLRSFRAAITHKQAEYITRIALSYWPGSKESEQGLLWLQNMPKLAELHLHVDEKYKIPVRPGPRLPGEPSRNTLYKRPATLLSNLRCFDNIHIEGHCPKLRAALASLAAEPPAIVRRSKRAKPSHKVAKKNRCKFCECRLRQYLTRSGAVKYNCTGSVNCPGRRAVR